MKNAGKGGQRRGAAPIRSDGSGSKKGGSKRGLTEPNGDKRYIKRAEDGTISETDDVSRSLSMDLKKTSKKMVEGGYSVKKHTVSSKKSGGAARKSAAASASSSSAIRRQAARGTLTRTILDADSTDSIAADLKSAFREVREIQEGKRPRKSLDDFLNEL